jgi:hypothetical protein
MPATDVPSHVMAKLRAEDLRDEVEQGSSTKQMVIVELALSSGQVEALPIDLYDRTGRVRFKVRSAPPGIVDTEGKIKDVRQAIESIVGRPTDTFFRSSGSLVVEATGEQMRRIAELPSVSAIWPNRIDGVPSSRARRL